MDGFIAIGCLTTCCYDCYVIVSRIMNFVGSVVFKFLLQECVPPSRNRSILGGSTPASTLRCRIASLHARANTMKETNLRMLNVEAELEPAL